MALPPVRRTGTTRPRLIAAIAAGLLVSSGIIAPTATANAASLDLVINEVYGGGGNSGATYTHDFVELANRGSSPVELSGLSLQYGSASGNLGGGSEPGSGTLKVDLSGSVQPGATYLVALAAGAGSGQPLPDADATGGLNLSASSGKIALVRATSVATCGTSCAADPSMVDFVGYGGANDFEGAGAAPGLTNATAAARTDQSVDTDDNAADFVAGEPTPTNAAGDGPPPKPDPETVDIPDIRGAAHRSPLAGSQVTTSGVVTAMKYDGFWVQDSDGDGDVATSDGIFVYTGSQGAKPAVGDAIEVTATVQQYRPGSASGANLSVTELTDATFTPLPESVPVPEPVVIGPDGRVVPPVIAGSDEGGVRTDIEASGTYDPEADAISFYKSLEGMLVSVRDAEVVGPTNAFGELTVVPAGTDGLVRTPEGGVVYPGYDQANTSRLTVDDEIIYEQLPTANVGDTLSGEVSGPLHYDWGTYRMYPDEIPTVDDDGVEPGVVEPPRPGELAVAAFNVENLSPVDPAGKFAALAEQIVTNLAAPDILALEEVQDNTGPECPDGDGCEPDGVVDADQTLDQLVAAIKAAGGPAYEWRQISPENLADGGQPTGNIRNAFLYRTDRGVRFVDRPGGDATTATEVDRVAGKAALTLSPGRIESTDPAFEGSRKPLAAEFTFRGEPLIVVANHFSSKGGDEPIFGRWQPPSRSSEADRWAQARVVHDFVARVLEVQTDAKVLVLGDINDFEFSQTTKILTGDADRPTLYSLPMELLAPEERYSYVYQGNSQVLDQILVSPSLFGVRVPGRPPALSPIRAYDVVHVNAGFADQVSDHDPQVVHLRPRPSRR